MPRVGVGHFHYLTDELIYTQANRQAGTQACKHAGRQAE